MTLRAEHQSARISKITNDGLTRSGTRYFIAVGYPYGNNSRRQRVKMYLMYFVLYFVAYSVYDGPQYLGGCM